VQTGNFLWQQSISKTTQSQLSLLGIDVIEYTRRQGVRERLTPSPYQESSWRFDITPRPLTKWIAGTSYGLRGIDKLIKNEFYLGYEKNQIFNANYDFFFKFGARRNFTSFDNFAHSYLGYFSRKWEAGLDLDYVIENYTDATIKHGVTIEASLSNYISRDLFSTVSVQRSTDEVVSIWTGFFKLGYRFGNQETTPIRDGSSPRGQL
jgi:hypothetical protein